MRNDSVLLCSFIRNNAIDLARAISRIKSTFDLVMSSVFVLEDLDDESNVILTYNVSKNQGIDFNEAIRDTIQVHRKKNTNTLYTLNALNEIIIQENNVLDTSYQIDWDEYNSTLILLRSGELCIIPTKLKSIIDLN